MEFLLLLSAFMSALTGAITGSRPPELGMHQAVSGVAIATVATPRAAATPFHLTAPAFGALPQVSVAPAFVVTALQPAVPIFSGRRRE